MLPLFLMKQQVQLIEVNLKNHLEFEIYYNYEGKDVQYYLEDFQQ